MLSGFRTVIVAIILSTLVGALFGVLVGFLAAYEKTIVVLGLEIPGVLQWIGLMALLGSGVGIMFGYGFLPDSEIDIES